MRKVILLTVLVGMFNLVSRVGHATTDCNCDNFTGNLTVGGKLGIGTTSPSSELEVNGTIAIDTGGATDHKISNSSGNLVINSSNTGGDVIIKLRQ